MVLVLCTLSDLDDFIWTKFNEKISKVSKLLSGQFLVSKFAKGHKSIQNVGIVMIVAPCTLSDHALYLYNI